MPLKCSSARLASSFTGGSLASTSLPPLPHRVVQARGEELGEVAVERAHRLRDRHLVVVEDHQQVGARGAGVVEALEGHPRAHRAVADDRDDLALLALALGGDRHAQRRRDRRRRVRGAEGVVDALGAPREARRPAGHPQPLHRRAPAGEDLVRVGLVPDVPDDAVARRVVDVVQRDRELDGAEVRRQVPAGLRDRVDHVGAQLARELRQRTALELAQRRRVVDLFE